MRCDGGPATHLIPISAIFRFHHCRQVTCGLISGLGPYILKGSTAAFAQVLTVALIKLSWAGLLIGYQPCVCLLVNNVIAGQVSRFTAGTRTHLRIQSTVLSPAGKRTRVVGGDLEKLPTRTPYSPTSVPPHILCPQFISEGVSALLLLIAAQPGTARETVEMLHLISFFMLLFPVFIPVMQKAYDGILVNVRTEQRQSGLPVGANAWMVIRPTLTTRPVHDYAQMVLNCCRKKFNFMAALNSGIVLLLAIPAFLAKVGVREACALRGPTWHTSACSACARNAAHIASAHRMHICAR